MRHLREIRHERLARGVLAQEHRQHHALGLAAGHQLLETHLLLVEVGNLDADAGLAHHVGHDADVLRAERAGQVAGHRLHLGDLRAGLQLHGVQRHHGSRLDRDDLAADVVGAEGLLQVSRLLADEALHLRRVVALRILEEIERREFVSLERFRTRDVLVTSHRLAVG